MKKLLLIFIMLVSTTGCIKVGFKDVDKRFFVLGFGVDKTEHENSPYKVTLKLGIPSSKIEPGQAKSQLITQEADNIPDAIRMLKSKVDKELDFGHAKMLIIGESLAKEDVRAPIDFFIRRRDIQEIAFVAVGSPSAADILEVNPKSEILPANALFLSFEEVATESPFIVTEYLFDFYRRMTEKGLDPYMPIIKTENNLYNINQVGVFDKQKMRAILTPEETRAFKQLLRKFAKSNVSARSKKVDFSLSIEQFKSNFMFDAKDEKKLQIKIKMRGIAEQSNAPLFQADWSEYEKLVGSAARERFLAVLQTLQKNKVDPLGLGLIYRAHHYSGEKDWENWQGIYPSLKFDVRVNVKMSGTGVIK
ncbi:Ger(x)C family spore germination protein [Paenibacillus cremeus]|uniref:Ger(X)C family spore germination protein n=1 Tax=Paenibacillus cremeus TaxID=2163881 RepID=A0A559JGI6_9BACL|nr:Ger(x)C family spore germination protein [Paenibacillus cremeus]TVX98978.1 Ger(x)C family spore germination protein [Paenibacillus cremeus]